MDVGPTIITAIRDPDLASLARDVLKRDYDISDSTVNDWPELTSRGQKLNKAGKNIDLVLLDEDFTISSDRSLQQCVDDLLFGVFRVCWVHNVAVILRREQLKFQNRCLSIQRKGITAERLRVGIAKILPAAARAPKVELPNPADLMLEEHIRSLDSEGDLKAGMRHLGRIAQRLWDDCQIVRVKTLAQGFSGAQVFLVERTCAPRDTAPFVVKLVKKQEVWRVQRGLEHWSDIKTALIPSKFDLCIPELVEPKHPDTEGSTTGLLVGSGTSYAMAYDFLGPPAGEFISFADAYKLFNHIPSTLRHGFCLPKESLGSAMLRHLFERLREAWFVPSGEVEERVLWTEHVVPRRQLRPALPYQLTSERRANTLAYLHRLEEPGSRLLENWEPAATVVRTWVCAGPEPRSPLRMARNVMISPVHRDLNRHNVLLYVRGGKVFLIDFDTYDPQGHTLEDFAHIETQIIYALMDCETDSKQLPALDVTPEQLPLWRGAADHLISGRSHKPFRSRARNTSRVHRAINLVQYVRSQALEVRRNIDPTCSKEDFEIEYGAALLYHTLRSISHRRISPFKRILAVYSAARLIKYIESLS